MKPDDMGLANGASCMDWCIHAQSAENGSRKDSGGAGAASGRSIRTSVQAPRQHAQLRRTRLRATAPPPLQGPPPKAAAARQVHYIITTFYNREMLRDWVRIQPTFT